MLERFTVTVRDIAGTPTDTATISASRASVAVREYLRHAARSRDFDRWARTDGASISVRIDRGPVVDDDPDNLSEDNLGWISRPDGA